MTKLEMTICVIHCNGWLDDTLPDPIQQSRLDVELEVLMIGPQTLWLLIPGPNLKSMQQTRVTDQAS